MNASEEVREAEAWFRDSLRLTCLDDATAIALDLRHAATIVRAALAAGPDWEHFRDVLGDIGDSVITNVEDRRWAIDEAMNAAHETFGAAALAGARPAGNPGLLTLDELIADVENALECAAIEVVVFETDDTGARTIESPCPMYRLARCLRSYGLLDERRDRDEDAEDDTTETWTEYRAVLLSDESITWGITEFSARRGSGNPDIRVESRTVSTTTRTTVWKAEQQ